MVGSMVGSMVGLTIAMINENNSYNDADHYEN